MSHRTIHLIDGRSILFQDRRHGVVGVKLFICGVEHDRIDASGVADLLSQIAESRILGGPENLVEALVWLLHWGEVEPPEHLREWVDVIAVARSAWGAEVDEETDETSEIDTYRLSFLPVATSGGEVVVWFSCGEFLVGSTLGPRILVVMDQQNESEWRTSPWVSLDAPHELPGELPESIQIGVVAWVKMNRGPLLRHWWGEIDTGECLALLTNP